MLLFSSQAAILSVAAAAAQARRQLFRHFSARYCPSPPSYCSSSATPLPWLGRLLQNEQREHCSIAPFQGQDWPHRPYTRTDLIGSAKTFVSLYAVSCSCFSSTAWIGEAVSKDNEGCCSVPLLPRQTRAAQRAACGRVWALQRAPSKPCRLEQANRPTRTFPCCRAIARWRGECSSIDWCPAQHDPWLHVVAIRYTLVSG